MHAFPGHIACDARTNAEVVVPMVVDGRVVGVLDVDALQVDAFSQKEIEMVEKLAKLVAESCDWTF